MQLFFYTMNLKKIILVIMAVTVFSLIYVWLATESVKIAYEIQKKGKEYKILVDNSKILNNSVNELLSLGSLENKISTDKDLYEFPRGFQISSFKVPLDQDVKKSSSKKKNILAGLLSFTTQAEARTTK